MLSRYPSISFACISSYLPNKVVAGCAADEEEDAELIPLLWRIAPRAMAG